MYDNDSVEITTRIVVKTKPVHQLSQEDWIKISCLSFVFTLASVANLRVLVSISKTIQNRISPMYKLMLHLCVADIIVVFTIIPSEIAWRITGYWYAGDFMCKFVQFIRAFGLNLSSLVLICISIDRYYAIVHPLRSLQTSQRVKHMIFWSWIAAAIFAIPQLILFRLETHHLDPSMTQCLSIWMGMECEVANTLLQLFVQYFIPLVVIAYSYGQILYRISTATVTVYSANNMFLRRSGQSVIDRARVRTVKLTLIIVIAFVVCWTPYAVIALWAVIDYEAVKLTVHHYVKDMLFQMVLANSCANPLLYGIYTKRTRPSHRQSTSATNTIELHTLNSTYLTRDSQRNRYYNNCSLRNYSISSSYPAGRV